MSYCKVGRDTLLTHHQRELSVDTHIQHFYESADACVETTELYMFSHSVYSSSETHTIFIWFLTVFVILLIHWLP